MSKIIRFGAAGALAAAAMTMSTAAFAQSADTATADARAEILSALTLTNVAGSQLDFGNIIITGTPTAASPTSVVLDPQTMDVACGAGLTCSGTTMAAQFEANGQASATLRVDLPANAVLSYNDGATTHTMNVDAFTMYSGTNTYGTSNLQELSLDANGMIQTDAGGNVVTQDVLDGSGNPIEVTTLDLDGSGNGYFNVGATLNIDDVKVAGVYTGTFDVSVEYN